MLRNDLAISMLSCTLSVSSTTQELNECFWFCELLSVILISSPLLS